MKCWPAIRLRPDAAARKNRFLPAPKYVLTGEITMRIGVFYAYFPYEDSVDWLGTLRRAKACGADHVELSSMRLLRQDRPLRREIVELAHELDLTYTFCTSLPPDGTWPRRIPASGSAAWTPCAAISSWQRKWRAPSSAACCTAPP